MRTCDLCNSRIGILSTFAIPLEYGVRRLCRQCFYAVQSEPTPGFAEVTCNNAAHKRFWPIFVPITVSVFVGLSLLGRFECTNKQGEPTPPGCFLGMFLLGFVGGCFLLIFPIVFWSLRHQRVRARRNNMAYRQVETRMRGTTNSTTPLSSPPAAYFPSARQAMPTATATVVRTVEMPSIMDTVSKAPMSDVDVTNDMPNLDSTASDDRSGNASRDSQQGSTLCVVCLKQDRQVAFLPCGHVACCSDCGRTVLQNSGSRCVICRGHVTSVVTVHIA